MIAPNAQAARLAGRAGRARDLFLIHTIPSKKAKHPTRPDAGTIITNAAVGAVMGVLATFGGRQRAVGEGSPERGERAKPRWFGAQGAE